MPRIDIPEYGTFVDFPDETDPKTIQDVLAKNYPKKEVKPDYAQGYVANAIGGKLPPGFEYAESGAVVPKQRITHPGISEPIEQASGVVDWLTRVLPESTYRTAVGAVKFPYDLTKKITDPFVGGMQRAISGGQDTPENVGQVAKELGGNIYGTAQGLAEFTGKPLGIYGWQALKEAWLSDPAASALGIAPLLNGLYGLAKSRGTTPSKIVETIPPEVIKEQLMMPTVGSGPPQGIVRQTAPLKGGMVQAPNTPKGELITQVPTEKVKYSGKTQADPIVERSATKIEPAYTDNLPSTEVAAVEQTKPMPLIQRDMGFLRTTKPTTTLETGGLQTIYERFFGNKKPQRYTRPGTPESLVDDMYERTQKSMANKDGYTWDKIKNSFVRGVVDVSGNVKSALAKVGGPEAQKAIMKKDLIAGAESKANMIVSDAEKAIFADMAPSDYELLNRYRTSKRMMEIGGYKPGVKGPEGLEPGVHASWVNALPPDKRQLLDQKQQQISAVYADQLNQLRGAGLITQEGFDALSKFADYNPRKFMQYLDPDRVFDFGGRKISVPDSGIKPLKEGSEGLLFNDSRTLLAQTVVRTQARIFRNEANKALLELADAVPDNGVVSKAAIVGHHNDGTPIFQKAPAGHEKVSVVIDGQKQELLMPKQMAEEWVKSDPVINRHAANIMGWMLGAKPLKMMATGWNPAFALTNIPRDLQLIWMSTKEYSPVAPIAMPQMALDMVKVLPDVVRNKGRVKEYINQGGGLEFLTTQGRVGGPFSKVSDVMGWVGTKSEMLTRMALRERAIKNGATPEQATHIARNYLDFSQGGNLVKMADVGFPYLNAAVQASRSLLRAAKTDPKLFAFKLGQVGVMATSIYNINRIVNREAWEQIPDRDKEFNWIFTLPEDFHYIDEDGNKRYYYMKVAKDQGIRPAATMFEALMEKFHTGKVPSEQVIMAWQDFLNIVPLNKLPPVFAASLGYLGNKDFWTQQDIWKGPEIDPAEEYTDKTHPAFQKLGEVTGLSPERSRYALQSLFTNGNPFVGMVGGGWKLATGDLPQEIREKAAGELLTSNKTIRRMLSSTNPMVKQYEEMKKTRIEDTTRRYKQNREIDTSTKRMLQNTEDQQPRESIAESIATAPNYDKERMVKRVIDQVKIKDIPDKKWWVSLNNLTAEAKADVWFKRFESSSDETKEQLIETAIRMPGFLSERVMSRIIELKTGQAKPQGGN